MVLDNDNLDRAAISVMFSLGKFRSLSLGLVCITAVVGVGDGGTLTLNMRESTLVKSLNLFGFSPLRVFK